MISIAINQMGDDYLFNSSHSAITFALNFSGQPKRPFMNRIASRSTGDSRGLGGLDGAAQAGMIRANIARAGRVNEQFVIARLAKNDSKEWNNAIKELVDFAMIPLAGCISHYQVRRGLVIKFFGVKIWVKDIAERCGINKNTAVSHNSKIKDFFDLQEQKAFDAVDSILRDSGIIP